MNSKSTKAGLDLENRYEPSQGLRPGKLARLAWLPIPLLLAAIVAGRVAGLRESYPSETLTLVLSLAFYTLVSLGTLFLIGRSFLALGRPGLLLLECGVLLWSLAGTVGDAVSRGDANVNVTIFNTGILLAGLCHLSGAALSLRPQRALRAAPLWLGVGSALVFGMLWLIVHAALANWLPVFFIPGQGGTPVRYLVLISAIIAFVLSAGLLLSNRRGARTPFLSWYAFALLLLAVGLFGVMIQLSLGCVVNWLGRSAQWLGGVYLLIAAIDALHESDLPLLPLEETSHTQYYRYGMAMAFVIAAAAVRLVLSPTLGVSAPFLTFFPAVILAALYGGWRAGLLATVLSALLTAFFLMGPIHQFSIGSPINWLALLFFFLSCMMIIFAVEAMHKARARLVKYQDHLEDLVKNRTAELEREVAERKRAEETLQHERDLLQSVMNGARNSHLVYLDREFNFVRVNEAYAATCGYRPEEMVGKNHFALYPHPENEAIFARVRDTGEAFEVYDKPFEFPDQPERGVTYWDWTLTPVKGPADQLVGLVFSLFETTERQQVEEDLRRTRDELELRVLERTAELKVQADLLDVAHDAIILRNLNGAISFWSSGAERTYGWRKDEAIGKTIHDLLRTVFPVPLEVIGEIIEEEGSWKGELVHTGKDGKEIVVLSRWALRRDNAERPPEIMEVNRDITDRKRAEEQLRHAQKMESIGTLAGGIAHDFNNILAAIIGFTEMTVEDLPDRPDLEKNLRNVMKSAMRARDLVKQILAFSRKTGHKRNHLSLAPVVEETVQLLRASIPATIDIRLSISATSDMVLGSPVEIQQILMNLATNASLAMEEKGGIIEISLTDIDYEPDAPVFGDVSPGEYIQLMVKDTGMGMSPDVMKRVFEPFFTTREVGNGTGMGLAVVYGIVKDLQGEITVESELGIGSTFRVFIPKAKADEEAGAPKPAEIRGGNERILFVDDEEMLAEWGKATLERLGYQVTAVTDSVEALNTFSTDPSLFDLVVTDLAMPQMAGAQLAQKLLSIRSDIPIILCTGHTETVSLEKAKKIGIREFLMKPLARQELAAAVRRELDGENIA